MTVTTNWTVAQQGNYLDGQITLDVGGTDRYAHMHNYRPSAASSLGLAGSLDYSATGLPVVPGQGPGAPTGGMASALGDPSVDELMSRMSGSSGSAADPLSGLLGAYGASGYSPALAASGASLDAAFAEVGRDHIHMYCFAAGTPVTMADGTQRAIELLQPNDLILATPDTDPTAAPQPYRITNTYHNAPAALLNLHIGDNILRVTPNHPLYIHNRGWVPASEVNIGDEMLTAGGNLVPVTDRFDNGDIEPVYNLHIAGARTYFVGTPGVLVHNTSPILQALIDQSAAALLGGVYGFAAGLETYFGGDGSYSEYAIDTAFGILTLSNWSEARQHATAGDGIFANSYNSGYSASFDLGIAMATAAENGPERLWNVAVAVGNYVVQNPLQAGMMVLAAGAMAFAPPAGFVMLFAGASVGAVDGILSTYAMMPAGQDPTFSDLAFGALLGGAFGAANPTMAFYSLGGGLVGGAIEYGLGGDFLGKGYLIGNLAGGLGGGVALGTMAAVKTGCTKPFVYKFGAGLRSVTPEVITGVTAGVASLIYGNDIKTAIGHAGFGMMGGGVLRQSSIVRNFADPRRGVCFAAGTLIDIPGGRKPIEDIRAGELVLSRSDDDPNGPIEAKVIEEVFVRTGVLWRLRVAGRELFCTAEHPFYVQDQGWTPAWRLVPGHRLSTDCGEWVPVESIECTDVESEVYNFRVADYHTYFVGGSGWGFSVWAHNSYDEISNALRGRGVAAGIVDDLVDTGRVLFPDGSAVEATLTSAAKSGDLEKLIRRGVSPDEILGLVERDGSAAISNLLAEHSVSAAATMFNRAITVEGDAAWQALVVEQLHEIGGTQSGHMLLRSNRASGKEVSIARQLTGTSTATTDPHAGFLFRGEPGIPSNTRIKYNSDMTQLYDGAEDWMHRPSEVGLVHELVHAEGFAYGRALEGRDAMHPFTKFEEYRVIGLLGYGSPHFSENIFRAELGIVPRPRF